jgi:U3 small nucleolar RNA-associated protein 23
MKAKRAKQYRKLMHQYGLHFGFREPYQVLLDAGTIQAAARFKMKLGAMLENTLHGQIKPMITQCCIRHLYNIQALTPQEKVEKDGWIEAAKSAERRRCGHHELEEPLSAVECLESVVDSKGSGRNQHRYVVASQDEEVRRKMRGIAGVPLVYINRSVMILEPMAGATEDVREREEKLKIRSGLRNASAGVKRKRDNSNEQASLEADAAAATEREPKKRKVKGAKGPNPLSVMKSKKPKPQHTTDDQPKAPKQAAVLQAGDSNAGTDRGARKRRRKRKAKEGDDRPIPADSVGEADE